MAGGGVPAHRPEVVGRRPGGPRSDYAEHTTRTRSRSGGGMAGGPDGAADERAATATGGPGGSAGRARNDPGRPVGRLRALPPASQAPPPTLPLPGPLTPPPRSTEA